MHMQGFIQDFFIGWGEEYEHWPVVLSQMLLCVVEMVFVFYQNVLMKKLNGYKL